MILTEQQKKDKVKDLRPIDDVFFEILAQSIPVYQEMLRTIMEDDSLIVSNVGTQSDERNLYGRSVRLDALCTLGNGTKVNIEKIQKMILKGCTKKFLLDLDYTEEEYAEAERELQLV